MADAAATRALGLGLSKRARQHHRPAWPAKNVAIFKGRTRIEKMLNALAGIVAFLACGVILLLWRSFFPTYVGEKGKNLAIKKASAAITNEVELVKSLCASEGLQLQHQNARLLEELRSRQQLHMAAVDRRLGAIRRPIRCGAHLLSRTHSGDVPSIVAECHQDLVPDATNSDAVKKNWQAGYDAFVALVDAM